MNYFHVLDGIDNADLGVPVKQPVRPGILADDVERLKHEVETLRLEVRQRAYEVDVLKEQQQNEVAGLLKTIVAQEQRIMELERLWRSYEALFGEVRAERDNAHG